MSHHPDEGAGNCEICRTVRDLKKDHDSNGPATHYLGPSRADILRDNVHLVESICEVCKIDYELLKEGYMGELPEDSEDPKLNQKLLDAFIGLKTHRYHIMDMLIQFDNVDGGWNSTGTSSKGEFDKKMKQMLDKYQDPWLNRHGRLKIFKNLIDFYKMVTSTQIYSAWTNQQKSEYRHYYETNLKNADPKNHLEVIRFISKICQTLRSYYEKQRDKKTLQHFNKQRKDIESKKNMSAEVRKLHYKGIIPDDLDDIDLLLAKIKKLKELRGDPENDKADGKLEFSTQEQWKELQIPDNEKGIDREIERLEEEDMRRHRNQYFSEFQEDQRKKKDREREPL